MNGRHRRRRARISIALDAAVVVLVVVAAGALTLGRVEGRGRPRAVAAGSLDERRAAGRSKTSPSPIAGRSGAQGESTVVAAPVALSIPSIGVHTGLVRLGLNADGSLEVPEDFSVAGWYELGPRPGAPGAAVIAGHVDSTAGPAVFYRLRDLRPGNVVDVRRGDGTGEFFRVYAVREFAKTEFPTSAVYGATTDAELRLITCGGAFDSSTGHYVDNVVVFARAVGRR
jgi:sortase (surface protein transpeptidase)